MRLGRLLGLRLDRLLTLRQGLLLLAASAAVREHLLKLLLLRVSEQRFYTVAAVFDDSDDPEAAIARGEALVGAEGLNLLLAIGDDGTNLSLLSGA